MSKVRRKGNRTSPPPERSVEKRKKPSVFSRLGAGAGPRKFRDDSEEEREVSISVSYSFSGSGHM